MKKSATKTTKASGYRIQPLELVQPRAACRWLGEPTLEFAGGQQNPVPKVGIQLYGPRSLGTGRHKKEVHVGIIGTGEGIGRARLFLQNCSAGIDGDDDCEPFPGCSHNHGLGYRSDLQLEGNLAEKITSQELSRLKDVRYRRQRFEMLLGLLEDKLQLLTERDHPLDYIVIALPEELYKTCRVADYREDGRPIHRDLRRATKAIAMKFRPPTQLLQETTTGLVPTKRDLDHQATIAWNFFNAMYFKVGGLPWGPTGLTPGTCYVGISFFRPLGETSTLRTSVVQAFDENGDGLILRGHSFHWNEEQEGRSPHLSAEMANQLVEMVLERYKSEHDLQAPRRVVVHKKSRFEPAEREGFQSALKTVKEHDLLAVCSASELRLIRSGTRPVIRGTLLTIGDLSYFYTNGYIPALGVYPHGHVPSPLLVADHVGDTPVERLLEEILVLTKMNWNSANMHGVYPITLRFSRVVGEILREVPEDQDPKPNYPYYM